MAATCMHSASPLTTFEQPVYAVARERYRYCLRTSQRIGRECQRIARLFPAMASQPGSFRSCERHRLAGGSESALLSQQVRQKFSYVPGSERLFPAWHTLIGFGDR